MKSGPAEGGASGKPADGRNLLLVVGAVVAVLALFLDKAFTIDDPLFLWLARHIQADPLSFFDFTVNWYGTESAMHEVTRNPPLSGYYLAGAAAILGWGEAALHGAYLVPAAGAAAGTYLLAHRLCDRPLEASLIGLLTPVFLVCSSSVMSDSWLLMLWCGSVLCWVRGMDRDSWGYLLGGAILAGIAGLTKYYGFALVPLLLAYGALRERRLGAWVFYLAVPIAIGCAYEVATAAMYGRGLFVDAAIYSRSFDDRAPMVERTLIGLAFAGGCLIPALFYAPLLWSRRVAGIGVVSTIGLGLLAMSPVVDLEMLRDLPQASVWQLFAMGLGGASLIGLVLSDLRHRKDPERWLLALWVLGTFAFATFFNWTNNGRSNLPMAPVLGILVVRRLEMREGLKPPFGAWSRGLAFAAGLLIALGVAYSDYAWANKVREVTRVIGRDFVQKHPAVHFQGHWGFQYYMEKEGARALNFDGNVMEAGGVFVVPNNNTQTVVYGRERWPVRLLAELVYPAPRWLRTVSSRTKAGFYSSMDRPLPFAFGASEPDVYEVFQAIRGIKWTHSPEVAGGNAEDDG